MFSQQIIFNFNKNIHLNTLRTVFLRIFHRGLNAIIRSIIRDYNRYIFMQKKLNFN